MAPALAAASLLLSLTASPPACPEGTRAQQRYTVLLAGNRAGTLDVCEQPDGSRVQLFEFNDRGRGPRTRALTAYDARGLPERVEIDGHDYLKNEVDERFTRAAARATWKNKAEQGESATSGFYVSYSGPPSEVADLARALLRSSGRLPLLPEGEARLDERGEQMLKVEGAERHVVHYALGGLGFTPIDVWLEATGPRFVLASRWLSVVPAGWEDALPALLAAQEKDAARRQEEQARRLARRPAGPLVFRNARVLDVEAGALRPAHTVVVSGDRITAVGPDATTAAPEGAELIDARGRVLMPGLWDMHVHLSPDDGLLHLAAGVTSVRDLANDTESLEDLRRRLEAGTAVGPHVVAAGFLDGPGPFQGPTKALAATEQEAREWVRRYAALGYRQVKLYSSLKPELVAPVADEAGKHGMRVSGHVPAFMTADEAVRAGYGEIQHVNMLFLNFFFDEVKDTRTPARFTAVAERAGSLDLGSERVAAFVRLLRDRKVVVDPTVGIFETMFVDRPGRVAAGFAPVADRLPPQVRRGLLDGGLPVPEGRDATYRASFEALLAMVKRLHEAGVTVVAGTDSMPGFALHRELELYARAGIPPAEVLRIATAGAARVAGLDGEVGTVAPGRRADLVLLEGDPLQDVSAVRRPALVVKGGVLYEPAALLQEVGVRPH